MVPGLELATQMVLDLCGGTPSETIVVGGEKVAERSIEFPVGEVKRLAGLDMPLPEISAILGHLGFSVAGSGSVVKVTVPSWRADVEGKADIVEEVVRIAGVDKVPLTPFDRGAAPRKPVLTSIQNRTRRTKRALAARNFAEAVTWSFVSKPEAELFGGGKPELALANPIASDLSDMRPSLLPGLIAAIQRNADRGMPDAGLFEVGQIFKGDRPEDQFVAAAGLRHGLSRPTGTGRFWAGDSEEPMRSMPRPMRWPRSRPRVRRSSRCRSCRAVPPGFIPAAPAPSRWARKMCSDISANFIRALWKR